MTNIEIITSKEENPLLKISRRKKQIRNLYSYLNRRKYTKNGGYLESSICSRCGRAITKNYELCRDCKKWH